MKPEMRPISVTIVDLMGALLPGAIWLVLFIIFGALVSRLIFAESDSTDVTVLSTILYLTDNKSVPFYVLFLMVSFCIGYSIKLLCLAAAEGFCAVFPYLIARRKREFRTFLFPYNDRYMHEPFFRRIVSFLNDKFRLEEGFQQETTMNVPTDAALVGLPRGRTQPFSTCKRILKVMSPTLWEENEAREAVVRMQGSLLLSALFSLFCSLFSFLVNSWQSSTIWLVTSVLIVALLGGAFRKARYGEVVYAYMNFLVAISFANDLENQNKAGVERAPKNTP